jgi:hypothetical protein
MGGKQLYYIPIYGGGKRSILISFFDKIFIYCVFSMPLLNLEWDENFLIKTKPEAKKWI